MLQPYFSNSYITNFIAVLWSQDPSERLANKIAVIIEAAEAEDIIFMVAIAVEDLTTQDVLDTRDMIGKVTMAYIYTNQF